MSTRTKPRSLFSTWKNMKVAGAGGVAILYGVFHIELRPLPFRENCFNLYYVANGRPVSRRVYTKNSATEKLRLLFQEQVSEWSHDANHH